MSLLIKTILYSFLMLSIFSCNLIDNQNPEKKNNNQAVNSGEYSNKKTEKTSYNFQSNVGISKSENNVNYKGNIIHKVTWKDENGENMALFTKKHDQIWIYHYAFYNDKPNLQRLIKDNEFNCEFDLFINFENASIDVTDLDGDNIGELSFMYKKTCTSDVGPMAVKLFLLENGDKYSIRGFESMNYQGEFGQPGIKNIAASFINGPKEFLDFANRKWEKFEQSDM